MALDPRDALSDEQLKELTEAAVAFSDVLRSRISQSTAQGVEVTLKADESVVTDADVDAEDAFRQAVIGRFPVHGVKGEEFPTLNPDAEYLWVVDPIDGTAEFVAGIPVWGTIIGLNYRDHPIVGVIDFPMLGLRAVACHRFGARLNDDTVQLADIDADELSGRERVGTPSLVNYVRDGSNGEAFSRLCERFPNIRIFQTCLTHVMAMTGGLDAAIEWNCPIWDIAATRVLIEEAGGRFECVKTHARDDGEMLYNVIFGRPRMVNELVSVLNG